MPAGAEAHVRLRQCLGNCNNANAAEAASKLDSLRVIRNDADYEIHAIGLTNSDAQHQLGNARRIIELLSTCSLPEIGQTIREYARQVLRLSVRSDA